MATIELTRANIADTINASGVLLADFWPRCCSPEQFANPSGRG
jgi:hypothetical protein